MTSDQLAVVFLEMPLKSVFLADFKVKPLLVHPFFKYSFSFFLILFSLFILLCFSGSSVIDERIYNVLL